MTKVTALNPFQVLGILVILRTFQLSPTTNPGFWPLLFLMIGMLMITFGYVMENDRK